MVRDHADTFNWVRAALACSDRLDPIMVVCAILAVDRGPWTVDRGPWTVDRGPWTDCYHQNLFDAQPCVTELAAVIQRPDLCDDFHRVGECVPPEAADPPTLSLE